MMLLSLDLSTTCCGVAIYQDQDLFTAEYVDLHKIKNDDKYEEIFEKAEYFANYVIQKFEVADYHLDKIVIEETLMRSNNQFTVLSLCRFNFLVSYLLRKHFNLPINYISVSKWRSYYNVKCKRGDDKKMIYFNEIKKIFPNIELEYKKSGKVDERVFDMSDAIALGYAFLHIENE